MGNRWDRFSDVLNGAMPGLTETLVMVAAILGLAWLTFLVRTWFRDDDGHTGQCDDLLTEMRELHREGGLTEDEFRLIKSRLVSATAGGPGALRQSSLPKPATSAGRPNPEPTSTAEPTPPSLTGRSDQPGQEASGLPDGQS